MMFKLCRSTEVIGGIRAFSVSIIRASRRIIRFLQFQFQRRFLDFPALKFDFGSTEANEFIKNEINGADLYVEFGAGASTIYAAEVGKKTLSIEADHFFAKKIVDIIEEMDLDTSVELIVRKIGVITQWSRPIGVTTRLRKEKFSRYSDFPKFDDAACSKVFVLIDGRFRIAAALKAGKALSRCEDYTIVVDDCEGRDYFSVLEDKFEISDVKGRLGVFKRARLLEPDYEKGLENYRYCPN
jgi:hypothetical protein